MLVIRPEQMVAFKEAALHNFENRLLEHLKEYFPNHWRVIGSEQLRKVIQLGVKRAERYGLTAQREVYLYISLMLYLGSYFDEDLQLPWAAEILNDEDILGSFRRVEVLHDRALAHMDEVMGPDDAFLVIALKKIQKGIPDDRQPPRSGGMSDSYLLSLLHWMYLEKYEVVGEENLHAMMAQAAESIRRHDIATQHGQMVFVSLRFLLGSRFDFDPQFPWAKAILDDRSIKTPEERAQTLYEKAMTTLEQWIA